MKKFVFVLVIIFGILSFSDNYFEGYWKIESPFEAELKMEYKGSIDDGEELLDVYYVYMKESYKDSWLYYSTIWQFEKNGYGLTCDYKGRNSCLSFLRGKNGAYITYGNNEKGILRKMNSSERKKFNDELNTKEWKIYKY